MEPAGTRSSREQDPGCTAFSAGVKIRFVKRSTASFPLIGDSMPNITLLVSPSCGACPSAKSLWKQLRVKYSFSYREVDITTPDGQELANRHAVRAVPATIIDGRLTFVGVPSRESAEKALQLKMRPREE
jgi:glutaredoxin